MRQISYQHQVPTVLQNGEKRRFYKYCFKLDYLNRRFLNCLSKTHKTANQNEKRIFNLNKVHLNENHLSAVSTINEKDSYEW